MGRGADLQRRGEVEIQMEGIIPSWIFRVWRDLARLAESNPNKTVTTNWTDRVRTLSINYM